MLFIGIRNIEVIVILDGVPRLLACSGVEQTVVAPVAAAMLKCRETTYFSFEIDESDQIQTEAIAT
jgi:hypothetical protein